MTLERAGRRPGLFTPLDERGVAGFDLSDADAIRAAESVFDLTVQPPESVAVGLANLKPTMHLRLNRKGKLSREWSYDVAGNARQAEYEPRWELWDTDESGRDYLVMVLRDADDNFREPGEWVVERFRKFNPANFGSLQEMLDFAHAERQHLRDIPENQWREFCEFMGDWCWWRMHTIQATEKNSPLPRIGG